MDPSDTYDPVPVPVMVISPSGQITGMNGSALDLFGERTVGRLYAAVLRQPDLLARIGHALEGETLSPVRYLTTEASRDVIYEAHVIPRSDGCAVISFIDKTHKEEAGQMRSDFVANVSHELRTPLTALSGFIETLRGPARDDAEARDRFLDIMEQEAGRMNRLVSDLLSLSRVEDMERMRPTDPLEIAEILNTVENGLSGVIRAQDVDFEIHYSDDLPFKVPGDRDQLIQVFTNLLENAIKYGKISGKVSVLVNRHKSRRGIRGPAICVTIEDQGDGIAAHHIGRLTERFYRVDGHRSREVGGTGLGLAIVKHVVNRHRGRLRIESEQGRGSRFTVCLPVKT
ncbi:ATP-binding protein [Aliiroseovarius sp. KMU-50]|uniref:histidine kinase n=1 Tax=Aliiroseovarius salicola TaxID=3009082 RepID=A0ABT4W340_9RHOB|nr:ATP-binding protein [Aliiroseovarius sp. KMU-50]MDA5094834.1 ATP-binding protein [Aliiroseovarius sp. KMU-50]